MEILYFYPNDQMRNQVSQIMLLVTPKYIMLQIQKARKIEFRKYLRDEEIVSTMTHNLQL